MSIEMLVFSIGFDRASLSDEPRSCRHYDAPVDATSEDALGADLFYSMSCCLFFGQEWHLLVSSARAILKLSSNLRRRFCRSRVYKTTFNPKLGITLTHLVVQLLGVFFMFRLGLSTITQHVALFQV